MSYFGAPSFDMAEWRLATFFRAWRDVAFVQGAGGLVVAVAGFSISRSAGRAIEGTDYSVRYSASDNQPGLPPQPKPLPLFHHQGRGQVPFKAMPGPLHLSPLDRQRRLWDQPRPRDREHDGPRERATAAGCGKATPYSDLPVPVKAPPPPKHKWKRRRSE